MSNKRAIIVLLTAVAVAVLAFVGCLFTGAADIAAGDVLAALTGGSGKPSVDYIVMNTRLPAAITALLCGMALSIAGLLMQTTFDNPLVGPSIMGISSGASLGVAIVMLALTTTATAWSQSAVLAGALAGALGVLALLTLLASAVRSATMLLIAGILIGYLTSSGISLLNFFATRESIHTYVIWGLGSFSGVTMDDIPLFAILVIVPALASLLYAKTLNALLLGSRYAASVGVNVAAARRGLLLLSGVLTAFATAWCGPIGFIGIVVPHIARMAVRSSDHRLLLPASALIGAAIGVLCLWICVSPGAVGILPVNAVTPIIGAPIILYIILKRRSIFYFN
ncbi:MAG: FecCD family ABC transporter permease [Muribaculaceae bacterium]